jgi:hypothetical protein
MTPGADAGEAAAFVAEFPEAAYNGRHVRAYH